MDEFKLIVAGGRDFNDYELLSNRLLAIVNEGDLKNYDVSIVSGMAQGADALAVRFATEHNVTLHKFYANWDKYGRRAGFLRNEQMAGFADGLLAFHDKASKGTAHMIKTMRMQSKPTYVINYVKEQLEFNYSQLQI